MVFPYLTSLFSKKKDKTQSNPTIFDTFPELNQGQAYLQRRNTVQQAMRGHLNLIESFATSSNASSVDWAYKASCPAKGQSSSCQSTSGCPNYGFCPPKQSDLLWKKDGCPGGSGVVGCKPPFDTLKSYRKDLRHRNKKYIHEVKKYVHFPPDSKTYPYPGQNIVVQQLTGAAYPWPPTGLLPQGHCNYLNVCAPKSYNLTEKEIVHGEKAPTSVEEAANAAAAKYGFTCKSYDSTIYGPDVQFIVSGQPVEVQQDFCVLEGGDITVTPSSSLTSLEGASYGAGHGGLVLLH